MKKIYLVIEQGAGIIHMGFESEKDAEDFANELKNGWVHNGDTIRVKNQTGLDCYEVQKLNFQPTKQVTIQELIPE